MNINMLHTALVNYNRNFNIDLGELAKNINYMFTYTKSGQGRLVLAPKGYKWGDSSFVYAVFSKIEFEDKYFNIRALEKQIADLRSRRSM